MTITLVKLLIAFYVVILISLLLEGKNNTGPILYWLGAIVLQVGVLIMMINK